MKPKSNTIPSIKQSIILMLVTGLLFTNIMACNDIEENGITSTEVQEVQANAHKAPTEKQPLFVINGEKIGNVQYNTEEKTGVIPNLKTEYIESVEILKGEKAIEKYGQAGKNGVIEIKVIDKELALSDLRTEPLPTHPSPGTKNKKGDYYISTDNPPKIKGGIQGIMEEVEYPEECKEAGIEGRVTVVFIVNKQGRAENPEVLKGIGKSCDEEALRVVKQAKFEPGTQNGKPVRVQMSIPILFRL